MNERYYKKDDLFLIRRKKTAQVGIGVWGSNSNRLYMNKIEVEKLRDFITSIILFLKYNTPLPLPQKYTIEGIYNDFFLEFDAKEGVLDVRDTYERLTSLNIKELTKLKKYLNNCIYYFLYVLKDDLPF